MQKRQSAQSISGLLLLCSPPLETAPGALKKAEFLSLEQPLLSFQSKEARRHPHFLFMGDESITADI
ncbi:hypothetical protein C3M17_11045 [Salmonella enterica]|nr:hypothetical protein [Salmonella enterica]